MKKKIKIWFLPLVIITVIVIMFNSCKKKDDTDDKSNPTPEPITTITDIDGNVYNTIVIGTQTWMVENLKVTKYRNGESISNITDASQWSNLTAGAYCNYENIAANVTDYGRLYNWYAVSDSRNIAPAGWHVPTDTEWTTLTTFLGGESVSGGKMKETGTTHWNTTNSTVDNSSGFTGLPGGNRDNAGAFAFVKYFGIGGLHIIALLPVVILIQKNAVFRYDVSKTNYLIKI